MRALHAGPDLVVRAPGDGRVILAGPPSRLRGQVHVTNTGATRSSLRGFDVGAHDLPAQPAPGRLGLRLAAAAGADVTASLALPPDTPPGEYHATLDVGGHDIEAILYVGADPRLDLTPARVVIETGPERRQLVLRNAGNVPVQLAARTRARLCADPDLAALPIHSAGVRERDAELLRPDAVLLIPGGVRLAPGEVAVVDTEIEVDGELDRERRYQALLPVGPATLRVILGPSAAAPAAGIAPTRGASTAGAPPRGVSTAGRARRPKATQEES